MGNFATMPYVDILEKVIMKNAIRRP